MSLCPTVSDQVEPMPPCLLPSVPQEAFPTSLSAYPTLDYVTAPRVEFPKWLDPVIKRHQAKPHHSEQWHATPRNKTNGRAHDPELNMTRDPTFIQMSEAKARTDAYNMFRKAYPKSKLKYENFVQEGSRTPRSCKAGGNPNREFLLDSGASMHMVSWENLAPDERKNVRRLERAVPLSTANGTVVCKFWTYVNVLSLNLRVPVLILRDAPSLISMGLLCRDHGFRFVWPEDLSDPYLVLPDGKRL